MVVASFAVFAAFVVCWHSAPVVSLNHEMPDDRSTTDMLGDCVRTAAVTAADDQ
jgi:hypothetical protein